MAGQPGRSGGARQGVAGQAYSNRTDLMQKPRTEAPIPTATPAAPSTPASLGPQPIPLGAPSQRPGEHVMSGSPMGAGPGPLEAGLQPPTAGNPVAEQLQALLAAYPNQDLADLIESMRAGDYDLGGVHGARF